MLFIIRIWIVILVLSVLSWLGLKVIGKNHRFFWVFLVVTVIIWGGVTLTYILSVWLAEQG